MWLLLNLLILLLTPSFVFGQAVDQEKIGFYNANKAGSDCSQATLEAADDAALAAGQTLWLPPSDRFKNACQWVVSSNLTIDSPLYLPYKSVPVLKVNDNITLTLQSCPYTDGDYFAVDANETTTGTLAYVTACGRCTISGANNYTKCTVGGDVSTNLIGELSNVNPGVVATDDTMMVGDGTDFEEVAITPCNPTTQKSIYDADTNTWSCQTDVSGGTSTLDAAFDAGTGEINNALCGTKTFKVSVGGDDFIEICVDAGGVPKIIGTCDGAACHSITTIRTDRNYTLYNEESAADMLTIDPDAASMNAMWQFGSNYRWLSSSEVVLRPSGDCTVAEEAIVPNDPIDEWITCVDTAGDAVSFNYKITQRLTSDTTVKITLLAVNKNAEPSGTFSLRCAAQVVRPGTDAYATHDITGQQTLSFTTFDTQNLPEEASNTFTLNGTLAVGGHVKGQCNVSAVPGSQISDIRLHATAIIELAVNSPSD